MSILVLCLSACGQRRPPQVILEIPQKPVVADGQSRMWLRLRTQDGRSLNPKDISIRVVESDGRGRVERVVLEKSQEQLLVEVIAGVNPGQMTLDMRGESIRESRVRVDSVLATGDYFRDGTPDFLRLSMPQDRAAFRHWFTVLAERQAISNATIPTEINDCAALLRYAYREAMRRHDSTWASDSNLGQLPAGPDIAKYTYPYTPLGPRLFRTKEGEFNPADIADGTFAEFSDAKTLITSNTHFLTRDVRLAQPGDLLFFRQFEQSSPFHSMIFVGRSHFGDGGDWVVYHTGPIGKRQGEMRRVRMQALLAHPDARWRPEISNPKFLGVYRWNILREAK
ncbi:MAG TPA: DUF1175 domain-containing protein [Clostridia bacterium]|nr:DUF1175 domain-containing protein [Clostridia bacterium]